MPKTAADSLRSTIEKLQRQLASIEKRQNAVRSEAIAFLVDAQQRLGVSLEELSAAGAKGGKPATKQRPAAKKAATKKGAAPKKKAGKPVAAKYMAPDGQTWTGRGLKPRWLTALLAEGRKLEEFLIGDRSSK